MVVLKITFTGFPKNVCVLQQSGLVSVTSASGADTVRATAKGNHCKSPCITCPQSGRKVLISDGSTVSVLLSVISGIISRVFPSSVDLIEEWEDKKGL